MIEETNPHNDQNDKINQSDIQTKKFRRFILDPFQIFCLENRDKVNKLNPNSKTFEITSILSTIWRNLNEQQKQHYHLMAIQLKNNKCSISRKKKNSDTSEQKNIRKSYTQTSSIFEDFPKTPSPEEEPIGSFFEKIDSNQMDRNMIDFDFCSLFDSN